MARKPTLAQVAQKAGVSIGTASNAFNRPDALSPALLDRVHAAADELGYTGPDPAARRAVPAAADEPANRAPAPAARRLRTGQAGAIGLIFPADLPFAFSDQATIEF